jgi:hypothetical protein
MIVLILLLSVSGLWLLWESRKTPPVVWTLEPRVLTVPEWAKWDLNDLANAYPNQVTVTKEWDQLR